VIRKRWTSVKMRGRKDNEALRKGVNILMGFIGKGRGGSLRGDCVGLIERY
jgi:hypothetical protein